MKSCHLQYPKTPPIVRVTEWKSKTDKTDVFFLSSQLPPSHYEALQKKDMDAIEQYFGKSFLQQLKDCTSIEWVQESIYLDDSIDTAIHKYCIYRKIKTQRFPYLWTTQPLRFNVQTSWEGYNIHPFQSTGNPSTEPIVQYIGEQLLMISHIHIALYESISESKRSHYFPNAKDTLHLNANQIKGYLNEASILNKLWFTNRSQHQTMSDKRICIFNRAMFKGNLKTSIPFIQLFNKLHSSTIFPMIQYIQDLNHIYYKVYKQHRISETLFQAWTSIDTIQGEEQCVLYSFLKDSSNMYAKIRIDAELNIYIYYKLDFSENITYETLDAHIQKCLQELQRYLDVPKIHLEIDQLSLRTMILLKKEGQLNSISKYLSSLLPIYTVPSKNRIHKNLLDLQFKRIQKYGQTKNIREYIKSKMALDIPILDILMDLQEYGIEEAEVRDYFEEIRMESTQPKERRKRDVRNLGLLIHLSKVSGGIQVQIDNASSFHDIHNALFWMRAALIQWEDTYVETKKKVPILPEEPRSSSEEEEIKPILREASDRSSEESRLSLDSDEMFGGAVGKEYHRYFNTLLKQIDPTIFGLTKNYARKCGVSDLRQPVGISKEQKKVIDQSPYKDGYDNAIEYGSSPDNQNVYMCPRIWCPKSQVPLTPTQYEKDPKCPMEDEKALLLYDHAYWYNDPNVPHYVGYLKEKGHQDVKLPCCFKKLKVDVETIPKPRDSKPKVEEESYIIDKPRQLPDARFGTIPQSLHDFIYPNVPYQLCRNTIKTQECLLRRGLSSSKDTFLSSIAYLFGFKEKEEFIKHVQKHLDPLTFLTLENGLVYQSFANNNPMFPEKEFGKRKELHAWLTKHKKYTTLRSIDWLDLLLQPTWNNVSSSIQFKILRELKHHEAYQHFITYLKNDEDKNPQFFYDLLHHLGVLLVVWNRDSQTIATLKCPYAYKCKQWWMGTTSILPYILVLKQDDYYEPLVLVDPSKNVQQRISFTKYEKMDSLISQCFHPSSDDEYLQSLHLLQTWIETMLLNPSTFQLTTIVLDYNHQIYALMTHGNLWIDLPSPLHPSSLPYLQKQLPIDRILFWEDIQGKTYDLTIPVTDYQLISKKIKQLKLGLQIGTLRQSTQITVQSILTIPTVVYKEIPIVPLRIEDTYQQRLNAIDYDNQQWYQVKKYMLKRLIENPSLTHTDFKSINQPSRVSVLLEELPKDIESLKKMYNELLLNKDYYKESGKIYEGPYKKEWIFSQKSLEQNDVSFIIHPNQTYQKKYIPQESNEVLQKIKPIKPLALPSMMTESKCTIQPFPTKWRLTKWTAYKIYVLNQYQPNSFYQLIRWVLHQHGLSFQLSELQLYTKKRVYELLTHRSNYPTIFEDPSMRKAWYASLKRQYRNVNELIDGLSSMTISDIQKQWIHVLENHSNLLWIQDIDLYNISRLFKLNLFMILKGKSVDKKKDDLVSSCKFIHAYSSDDWKYYPILLVYREISEDKSHHIYGLISKENTIGYYRQAGECPEEILEIIEKILRSKE